MTVEVFTPAPTYTVSGIGPYAIGHPYVAGSIRALVTVSGVEVALDPGDITVTPAAAAVSGSLFLSAGAAATHAGRVLRIERVTVAEQGWVGVLGEREKGLESQLDRTTYSLQELVAIISRSLRTRDPIAAFVPQAGRMLMFDGTAIVPGSSLAEVNAVPVAAAAAASSAASAAASAAAAAAVASIPEGLDVRAFGAVGDGDDAKATANTAAIRAAFDAAMALLYGGGTNATVNLGPGVYCVNDELLSDDFQEKWWLQTNLRKQKFITLQGEPGGASEIRVAPTWLSGVRNTANGNQRTTGPFAGQPSPACILPVMADKNGGAPAAFSVVNVRFRGTDTAGRDPIPWFVMNELDAKSQGVHIQGFANWGEVIMGSFNSTRSQIHVESCGAQPLDCGVVLGGSAGFISPRIGFDYDATTNIVSAKALSAFSSYAINDPVPLFRSAHVGKAFVLHRAWSNAGLQQPLRCTIATVSADGVATATLTPPAGLTDVTVTNTAGSFYPVRATTTAGSAVVALSSPIKIGRGTADMVGQLVAIPKAGSTSTADLDLFCSRVIAVGSGDDTAGYSQLTLAAVAWASVTDDLIWSCAHSTARDETALAAGNAWNMDNTDFNQCRWENSGGFSDDSTAGAYQFISQDAGEACRYISCKIHGANPVRGQFAAEGQVIIDAAVGMQMVACDFTHMGTRRGQVRIMGLNNRLRFYACGAGSWQLAHDFNVFYVDPKTGYQTQLWDIFESGTLVKNDFFPGASQAIWGKRAGLTEIDRINITTDQNRPGTFAPVLSSADDLDALFVPGVYDWGASVPTNAPAFAEFSNITVTGGPGRYRQVMQDTNNNWTFERDYAGVSWSAWRLLSLRAKAATAFADAANDVNTLGKFFGLMAVNTTDNKAYIARGPLATDIWVSVDGATTVTPS